MCGLPHTPFETFSLCRGTKDILFVFQVKVLFDHVIDYVLIVNIIIGIDVGYEQ